MQSFISCNSSSQLCHNFHCRGESFRPEYRRLGEVRALIPRGVNIMALTATASSDTRSDIVATLCMDQPAIISESPHKKNIMYIIKEKNTLEDLCEGDHNTELL